MVSKVIRVHRHDSAFVYAILESLEGMTSYSTIDYVPGTDHRDLELQISPYFLNEVETVLEGFRKIFPVLVLKH